MEIFSFLDYVKTRLTDDEITEIEKEASVDHANFLASLGPDGEAKEDAFLQA